MERIEDKDMAPLWAEHYPKRQDSVVSKALCLTICRIVENKVARNSSDERLFDNAAKPPIMPRGAPILSTSGINSEATAAIISPAAKCWIALLAFTPGVHNKARTPPNIPVPVAIKR